MDGRDQSPADKSQSQIQVSGRGGRALSPVDGEEGATDEREAGRAQVRHVHVGVLQPGVEHQPHVGHGQGAEVERGDVSDAVRAGPGGEQREHGQDPRIGQPHLRPGPPSWMQRMRLSNSCRDFGDRMRQISCGRMQIACLP